jgi:opacity protein-like surface antigen
VYIPVFERSGTFTVFRNRSLEHRYCATPGLPGQFTSIIHIFKDGGMKHRFTISTLTLLVCLLAAPSIQAQYQAGAHYIGATATIVTEPVGWGVQYEMGYDEHIGLGILVRYWGQEPAKAYTQTGTATLERQTFAPMFQARYHFLPKEMIDPFAGLRIGYSIYTETWTTEGIVTLPKPANRAESGISMSLIGGMRYFVSDKISLEGILEYFVVNDEMYFRDPTQTAITFGVNFTLN